MRRAVLLVALAAIVLFFAFNYPQHSFSLFAGIIMTFSTTSTLIFFAFAATALLIGFDRAYNGRVVQAEPTDRGLGDQFVR